MGSARARVAELAVMNGFDNVYDFLLSMLNRGYTRAEIAKQAGVSPTLISQMCVEAGVVPLRPASQAVNLRERLYQGRYRARDLGVVETALEAGKVSWVRTIFGCSSSTAQRLIEEYQELKRTGVWDAILAELSPGNTSRKPVP